MNPRALLGARGRGPGSSLVLELVRPLTPEDLIMAATQPPTARLGPPPLKTLKSVHQQAARLLAAGYSDLEVATAVNRTPQRIRDLKVDPAFANLVEVYKNEVDSKLADATERGANLMAEIYETAAIEIRDRLEDDAKLSKVPLSELRQIAQMAADRSVAPPKVAQQAQAIPTQITFNIAGRGLTPPEDARPEAPKAATPVIDLEAEDIE
jgi:hypothetical protein